MQTKINKRFILLYSGFVLLPLILILLYLTVFAKNRYVSESTILVKQVGEVSTTDAVGLGALLGVSNTSTEDANILKTYIGSRDMVEKLDKQLNLKKAFSPSGDPIFSLKPDPTIEDLVEYFNKRVSVDLDDKTMMLQISSQAFSPQFSLLLNQQILNESENFINNISLNIAKEQLKFAEKQLNEASVNLKKSRDSLLAYQDQHEVFDPQAQAQAVSTIVAGLQGNLAQLKTEERTLLSYLNPDAPQVVAIRSQIESVQKQIDDENAKLTSPKTNKLNKNVADFEELKSEVEFSTDLYKLALGSLEKARLEASRKLKKLVIISSPRLAEDALYPRILYLTVTSFILLNIIFGIGMLIHSIVREHRE